MDVSLSRLEPMEGGWGWMVVLGSCINHLLIGAVVRSMGVIYLLFLERFNTSATLAAWFTALPLLLWTGLGPLTTTLCDKYSCRSVTVAGGLLLSGGLFSAAFVSHPVMIFLTFGLISGTGLCFIYVPGYLIVGEYFDKKKGMAMALSTIGSGVGAFAFPPLIQLMFEYYGFQGCFVILSAITLNGCVGGFLYRPYKENSYVKRYIKAQQLQAAFNSPLKPLIGGATDHKKSTTTQPDSVDCSVTPPPIKAQPMNYIDEDNNLLMMCDDKERLRHASKSVENITLTLNGERIQLDPMSGAMFNKKRKSVPGIVLNRMSISSGAIPIDIMYPMQRRPSSVSQMKMMTRNLAASLSKLSQSQASLGTYNLLEAPVDVVALSSETDSKLGQIDYVDCSEKPMKKKIFHWELLKQPTFLCICLLGITSNATFAITVNFLPGLGKDNDMTSKEGAFLLSLLGLGDTLGRLPVGILFDLPIIKIRRNMIYGIFMTVNGIVTAMMPLTMSSKSVIYTVCIVRGLTSGVFMSQRATILADMIGISMVANAFGMQLLIMTLGALVSRMAGGAMKDIFGRYNGIFYWTGVVLVLSTFVFCGYIYVVEGRAKRRSQMAYGFTTKTRQVSEARIRST